MNLCVLCFAVSNSMETYVTVVYESVDEAQQYVICLYI